MVIHDMQVMLSSLLMELSISLAGRPVGMKMIEPKIIVSSYG